MNSTAKVFLIVICLAAAVAAIVWAFLRGRAELLQEGVREEAVKVPPRISRSATGEVLIHLDRETQVRLGLQVETLAETAFQPEITAYGRLQEDPGLTFTLRAPLPGTVRPADGSRWPAPGEQIRDGQQIGLLELRLTPLERLDLAGRLAAARAEVTALQAGVTAAEAALERAKALNADDKNVSDRALQEAASRAAGETARLSAARETLQLLESFAVPGTSDRGPLPLALNQGGEVVEVLARPGESVESGQPIVRVQRFDRLIAKVDLPVGEVAAAFGTTARIVVVGFEGKSIPGTSAGRAPAIDPRTLGQGFLFRIENQESRLRPGAAVTAYLPASAKAGRGVIIPQTAVIRDRGKSWAYAQISDGQFTRREVPLDHSTDRGLLVSSGFHAGERVVVGGAQLLLSEELKSQIQILEESEKK